MEPWHFYLMATLYFLAGITHFLKSKWFTAVTPPNVPHKLLVVHLTGLLEIYLAALLIIPFWKHLALKGIMVMLLFYFPVHVYMLRNKKFHRQFPSWALWLRLFMQFGLIYWAYSYL